MPYKSRVAWRGGSVTATATNAITLFPVAVGQALFEAAVPRGDQRLTEVAGCWIISASGVAVRILRPEGALSGDKHG